MLKDKEEKVLSEQQKFVETLRKTTSNKINQKSRGHARQQFLFSQENGFFQISQQYREQIHQSCNPSNLCKFNKNIH